MRNVKNQTWRERSRVRRYLCLFLVAVLVTTQCTQSWGVSLVTAQATCDNHPIHDGTCSYAEETRVVQACNHADLCDETCSSRVLICAHTHDESCSIAEVLDEQQCTHSHEEGSCDYNAETQTCTHTHDTNCHAVTVAEAEVSEGSECVNHEHTEECYECQHEHNTECGYLEETVVVAECDHECESCKTPEVTDSEAEYEEDTDDENQQEQTNPEGEIQSCDHAEDQRECLVCNPAGTLNPQEVVFNKNKESDDYADIIVTFEKGADALATIERNVDAEAEEEPVPEKIEYELSEDGQTITLRKEKIEELEEGEHTLYFVMASGEKRTLLLTVTSIMQVEEETTDDYALETADTGTEVPEGEVSIADCFPDPVLSAYVSEKFDTNKSGGLDADEITAATSITINGTSTASSGLASLEGIEYLTSLTDLEFKYSDIESLTLEHESLLSIDCNYSGMESLDVSGCTSLQNLYCYDNNLKTLDVSNNKSLTSLGIGNNSLESLILSENNKILTFIDAYKNYLKSFDISGFTSLSYLDIANNSKLESLDVSGCIALRNLILSNNSSLRILNASGIAETEIDFNTVTGLEKLNLSGSTLTTLSLTTQTKLEELNVSNCTSLTSLTCTGTALKSLDASGCVALTTLECSDNELTNLKLDGCMGLTTLRCHENNLSSIDLSVMPALNLFGGSYNNFTSLNFSENPVIKYIWVYDNQLKSIEFGDVTTVNGLGVQRNQLEEIDISKLSNLTEFYCENNNLTSIDLSHCKTTNSVFYVRCQDNNLTSLTLGESTITTLDCGNNNLMSLDVSGCTRLTELYCQNNQLTELNITGRSFAEGKFDASAQRLGMLPLYQTNGKWVNDPASNQYRTFALDGTTFYSDANMKKSLSSRGFTVANVTGVEDKTKGVLTAKTVVPMLNPVYFESVLNDEGLSLSGSLTYSLISDSSPLLSASIGYIDVNDAKKLKNANELANRFTLSGDKAPAGDASFTVECADFAKVKAGTPGQYDVTIVLDNYYCNTKLEVGVDINYSNDGGKTFVNFPDAKFREFVSSDTIDKNQARDDQGFLTSEELNAVKEMKLSGTSKDYHEYKDLTGIEYFTKLQILNCTHGELSKLDVSKNTALTRLDVGVNSLTSLDVSENTALDYLSVSTNSLNALNVSNNVLLTYLNVENNLMDRLDVSKNTLVESLYCHNNNLTSLDVCNNTALTGLTVDDNELIVLDLQNNKLLKRVTCKNNRLTKVLLSEDLDLSSFSISGEGQNAGTLSMYYDTENSAWVNSAKNSSDTVREFMKDSTTFWQTTYDDNGTASVGEQLSKDEFQVNDAGNLMIDPETTYKGTVSFKSTLANGEDLSGTFTYTAPEQYVADGYIDVNAAKALDDEEQLLEYFEITEAPVAPLAAGIESTYEIECKDYTAIKAGTLGKHNVTITAPDGTEYNTVLEVGVQIDYSSGVDEEGNPIYINFPDPMFMAYVSNPDNIPGADDGFLTLEELMAVEGIDIKDNSITDLEGIEHFINLKKLSAVSMGLKKLDVSKNANLQDLQCWQNDLTELDLSNNLKLTIVNCWSNRLTKLNVSGLTELTELCCGYNPLRELNLSNNPKLTKLDVYACYLTELDLSNNPSLTYFHGTDQTIGTLPMYRDAEGNWVNTAKNSKDVAAKFNKGTIFKANASDPTPLSGIQLNSDRAVTVQSTVEIPNTVYFQSEALVGGAALSGTFSFATSDLAVSDGRIDVNEAKALNVKEDILNYLAIELTASASYTVTCPQFSDIQAGTPGEYAVTVSYGNGISKETTVTVGVEIEAQDSSGNYLNFPDRAFREHIMEYVKGADDGFLTAKELDAVTLIDVCGEYYNYAGEVIPEHECSNRSFTSLKGIEYFTKLKELHTRRVSLEGTLDLSKNTLIERALFSMNENLKAVNIDGCFSLSELVFTETSITTLDVSHLENLTRLGCAQSKLEKLVLGNHPYLYYLSTWGNENLNSLDVSGCPELKYLYCYNQNLTELDLSNNDKLERLQCQNNQLTSLDVSNCPLLINFECMSNQLVSIKINENAPFSTVGRGTATDQNVGKLSMYSSGKENIYVNRAKNSADKAVAFMSGFTFKEGSSEGAELNTEYFYVNDTGTLTINVNEVDNQGTIYFENVLADGKITLNGTFSYETTDLSVSDGRIDVNEAKKLRGKEDLLDYISAEDLTIEEGATYKITCPDFDALSDGIPGDYTVTVTSSTGITRETVVQVGVKIDYQENGEYKNFPDEDFRGYVAEKIAGGNDGFLTSKELAAVTELDLSGTDEVDHPYEDLTGIEYFTNLKILDCKYGSMVYLDVSKNTKLETFTCAYNELETLILGEQNNLQDLRLGSNKLQRVEIKDFPALHTFYISGALELVSLTVDNCPALKFLNCSQGVKMTELEIIDCPMLETLYCNETAIPRLDVSTFSELKTVRCHYNDKLSELNVSGCTKLEVLLCDRTILTSLDVSNCKELKTLRCYSTNITSLDVSGLTNLNSLACYSSAQLKSLDISGCTALTTLRANNCRLTSLNIEDCPLTSFSGGNQALGTLSMHTDGDFIVNKQKSSEDVVATFMSETTFKSSSTTLNEENVFYVDDKGALTIDPEEVENPGTITFATPELTVSSYANLSQVPKVSGSFTYAEAGTITLGNYIERNDAIALGAGNADKLAPYINLSGNETIPTGVTVTVDCEDYDAYVLKGTPGKYDVTVSWTDGTETVTKTGTVDVVVQIANAENFADEDFQNYVAEKFDTGALTGYLTIDEISLVTSIIVNGISLNDKGPYDSLEGVQFFTNLQKLYFAYNNVKTIDLSKNTKLTHLDCGGNNIGTLDLSGNLELTWLSAPSNGMTKLDISNNKKLETLCFNENQWIAFNCGNGNFERRLDLSNYEKLQTLMCSGATYLISINVSNCVSLTNLHIERLSILQTLDVSGCISLTTIGRGGATELVTLNAAGCTSLTTLDFSGLSKLESLDVSGCTSLEELRCYTTAITSLNIDGCDALRYVEAYNTKLTSVNISGYAKLEYVTFSVSTELKSVDISDCESLTEFYCRGDVDNTIPLETINLSNLPNLGMLHCYKSMLNSLNIENCPKLWDLRCYETELTSLDLSDFSLLEQLRCYDTPLENLDISSCTNLHTLDCHGCKLSSLDISKCPLKEFDASAQELGTLSMYADTANSGCYINEANNSTDVAAKFQTGTAFVQGENSLTEANGFSLNGKGVLNIKSDTAAKPATDINFTKTLDKNANATIADSTLSGTFQYAIYDVIITDGTIERNDAIALKANSAITDEALVTYFGIDEASASKYTVTCNDFTDKVLTGTPGCYDVTLSYTESGNTIERTTVLDVVVAVKNDNNFGSAFQSYVSRFDTEGTLDGNLSIRELEAVTEIRLNNKAGATHPYGDLTGIGFFTNLETLDCSYGPEEAKENAPMLTTLDLSNNTQLKTVDCSNNAALATLTLGTNANLETLDCSFTTLGTNGLDIEDCPNLTTLKCISSNLGTLNVDANTRLETLYCSHNGLPELTLDNHHALKDLSCDDNELTVLDVTNLTSLQSLSCDGNALTSLDVTGLTNLTSVQASGQTIEEPLNMSYSEDGWMNTVVNAETETLRTFQPGNATDFYKYSGTKVGAKTSYFAVNGEGTLTADTLLPKLEKVYFVSDLKDADGNIYSGALNGTFTYALEYGLTTVNRQMYTSDEIVAYGFTDDAELNQLGSLLNVEPNVEEVKAQVEMEMAERFEDFASGAEGTYTYKARLNEGAGVDGFIDVVQAGAVVNAERTKYIYAENIVLGTSMLRNFEADELAAKILEKAQPVYGAYNNDATNITEVTESTNFTVDSGELEELQAVSEESKHTITISSNAEAGLAITIRVRVINDEPSDLVKIPANIVLSREFGEDYATGEAQIQLYSDFTHLVTGTINVFTDKSIYLSDVEKTREKMTVDIYNSENLSYNGIDPLVTLNENEPAKTFKLKSRNVKQLKGKNYSGTMEFVIEYK